MAENKIKVNELQTATPQLSDTLLASGAEREYACRISDLKDAIGGGGGLNNAKDAENGGIIEGLINGNEGEVNVASGENAHAEGGQILEMGGQTVYAISTASGVASHAEGGMTTASGMASHAEGWSTIANHASQHVFGEYNIADPSVAAANKRGNYVEIVGNGAGQFKSNARTLDWSGNEWLAGKMTADLGIVLKSPDGSSYTLTMNNDGTLKITKNT